MSSTNSFDTDINFQSVCFDFEKFVFDIHYTFICKNVCYVPCNLAIQAKNYETFWKYISLHIRCTFEKKNSYQKKSFWVALTHFGPLYVAFLEHIIFIIGQITPPCPDFQFPHNVIQSLPVAKNIMLLHNTLTEKLANLFFRLKWII